VSSAVRGDILTLKVPIRNMPIKIALFFFGSLTLRKSGIGIAMIIMSEEILRTAFVMR
jgi:hypothetical protein